MRAKDIMSSPVIIVYPETPARKAADVLAKQRISIIPVIDVVGALVGTVSQAEVGLDRTEPDLESRLIPQDGCERSVAEVMKTDVITVAEGAEVAEVARLMIDHGLEAIPVTNGTKMTGIVARHDLVRMLARSDVEIEADLDNLLDDETLSLGSFRAEVGDGVVTLRGPQDTMSRRCAAMLAKSLPGVVRVVFADRTPRSVAIN
jgi:predicted transcriptional regulator